jgi:hypothetical protein
MATYVPADPAITKSSFCFNVFATILIVNRDYLLKQR